MRHYKKILGSVFAFSIAIAAVGCTDEGSTLLIRQNQKPGPDCVLSDSVGADIISRGVLDVQSTAGYVFTPLVESLAGGNTTPNGGTDIAFIEGADVDIAFQDGFDASGIDASLLSFSINFSASIDPGGSAALVFDLVPRALVESLRSRITGDTRVQIEATVKIFGKVDGGSVKSQKFSYYIEACNGCLVTNVGSCVDLDDGFEADTGGGCNPSQDFPVDCCTDSGGAQVCPAEQETVTPPPALL